MRSRTIIVRSIVLAGGLALGLAGQTAPATAALPFEDLSASPAAPGHDLRRDALSRPFGWQPFDMTCTFGSEFVIPLDRIKGVGERIVVRSFKITRSHVDGQLLRTALGLDCSSPDMDFE